MSSVVELSCLPWIKVETKVESELNCTFITNIIKIDNDRFAVLGLDEHEQPNDENIIHQYDTNINEWKPLFTYSKQLKCSSPSIVWNNKTQIICMIAKSSSNIIEITKDSINMISCWYYSIGDSSRILLINNEYHIFGGAANRYHRIFNAETKQFNKIYEFENVKGGITGHKLIHIKSKNIVLMFGGFDYLKRCRLSSNDQFFDSIYCYFINDNKWKLLIDTKLPQKLADFGCIMTVNEKYIIFFGGMIDIQKPRFLPIYNDKIYVMDIDKMDFKVSSIKCKPCRIYDAVLMEYKSIDKLLVFGFVRQFSTKQSILISKDIMNLIVKWYAIQWIHSIQESGDDHLRISITHWKIALHLILDSV